MQFERILVVLLLGISLTCGAMFVFNSLFANKYMEMDKNGEVFSCDDLISDMAMVAVFEKDSEVKFNSCRQQIDLQMDDVCKEKVNKINPSNFADDIVFLEKYCNYSKKDFVRGYENEHFEIMTGSNVVVRVSNEWRPISGMVLWDPFKAHTPDNGLYKLCLVDEGAYCHYFKSIEDAKKEHGRVLNFIVNS